MPSIRDALLESNPWWGAPFEINFKERDVYKDIQPFIKLPQIVAFTGLRRVGKTTLMYKIIQESIKTGFNPRNIIYFSYDELKEVEIREVVNEYEKITGEDLKVGKHVLLIDEIQKLAGWENQLKRFYDLYYGKVKIIISGSESLFIRKRSKETLGGRLFEFKVSTLSFKEFLDFKAFKFDNIDIYHKELARLFDEFVITLGFPELIGIKETEVVKKYIIDNIIEKVVYRDIPTIFKIEDQATLESMLRIIMEGPGEVINIVDLANDLHISRHTASNYLSYLEYAFLIRKLYNFSTNRRKLERKLKKYYPEIISPNLLFKDDEVYKSKVFEWLIVKLLGAEFFWRDVYKNEVDIVLAENGKIIPIEVKYGKIDTKGMNAFLSKFKANKGYIVSYKENLKEILKLGGKTIEIVPAFKFLLKSKLPSK